MEVSEAGKFWVPYRPAATEKQPDPQAVWIAGPHSVPYECSNADSAGVPSAARDHRRGSVPHHSARPAAEPAGAASHRSYRPTIEVTRLLPAQTGRSDNPPVALDVRGDSLSRIGRTSRQCAKPEFVEPLLYVRSFGDLVWPLRGMRDGGPEGAAPGEPGPRPFEASARCLEELAASLPPVHG